MPAPTDDPATPDDNNGNNGNLIPMRRPPARRHGEITVERIETVPMTPEQYRRAVTALAQLINEWKYGTDNRPDIDEKAA